MDIPYRCPKNGVCIYGKAPFLTIWKHFSFFLESKTVRKLLNCTFSEIWKSLLDLIPACRPLAAAPVLEHVLSLSSFQCVPLTVSQNPLQYVRILCQRSMQPESLEASTLEKCSRLASKEGMQLKHPKLLFDRCSPWDNNGR